MAVTYRIISTGSQGNAVIVNDTVLIDCGVPYKALEPFVKGLRLVLMTHIHSDHFRPSTVRRLALERPTLRFGCCRWMVASLLSSGVRAMNLDILNFDIEYRYGLCDVIPVPLAHNVPNCGYKIHFSDGRVFYATDTNNLNGVSAVGYDLYMVEANYEDDEIKARIDAKKGEGRYCYELDVLKNHLSKAKADDFIYRNIRPGGEYVYLHRHTETDESREVP